MKTRRQCSFEIETSDDNICMFAETEREKEEWINALSMWAFFQFLPFWSLSILELFQNIPACFWMIRSRRRVTKRDSPGASLFHHLPSMKTVSLREITIFSVCHNLPFSLPLSSSRSCLRSSSHHSVLFLSTRSECCTIILSNLGC
jgi:hypothetical protein